MTDPDRFLPSGHRASCDDGDPCSCERRLFLAVTDQCLECCGEIASGLAAFGAVRCHDCRPALPVARPSVSG